MDNAFIGILRDHLLNQKTNNSADLDWNELL